MAFLSETQKRIKPSATMAVSQKASELRAEGHDVIGLGAGEPDFDTPAHICQAAKAALDAGYTRYTAVDGIGELKSAIIGKLERDNALRYTPEQILVGTGGKQVLFNALLATLDPDDEVIIPAPYWVSYPEMTRLAGGNPIVVETHLEHDFKLAPDALEAALTSRTKWVIINSPSNPTGAVYDHEELRHLADVLSSHPRVHVLSDDIYEHLRYDHREFATIAAVAPEIADRVLICNGLSKAYCMTGWRIGYGAGPAALVRSMAKIQSQTTSNPCSIAQHAAVAALEGPQDHLDENRRHFQRRRDLVADRCAEIAEFDCMRPAGAFYLYPSIQKLIGMVTPGGKRIETDLDFVSALLESEKVALVPGTAFGKTPCFRLSFATEESQLIAACERIARFVASLT